MSRHTDVASKPHRNASVRLPVVDWSRIGREAPVNVPIHYEGPDAKLPKADVVVITWTTAEWSALDHVFVNSDSTRSRSDRSFEKGWYQYSRSAPDSSFSPLWGYYRLVTIKDANGNDQRVLLFKSGAHLAHPPWIAGLTDMVKCIVEDAAPTRLYTIGTAGGSSEDELLGDVAITNSGHVRLKKPENVGIDYNNQTVTCENWFPAEDLLADTTKHLFFQMNNVVNGNELNYLLYELHKQGKGSEKFTLKDLVNKPLDPANLGNNKPMALSDKPLLTTDFYYIADGPDAAEWVVLEMDDAVIGHAAGALGVDYAFVRNISDPVVAATTPGGEAIPDEVRESWSSLIYENFGLYTSFNGALTTWATIAAAK